MSILHGLPPVALAALIGLLPPGVRADSPPEISGKAVSMMGRVLIRNERQTGGARELKVGDAVVAGDVVNTRNDSTVKLLMTDKSILDLGPSTLFKVDEYSLRSGGDRVVTLSMGYGKIRTAVNTPVGAKGRFTIRTKAATMGVRGTEFLVASELGNHPTNAPPPAADGIPAADAAHEVKTQITVIHGKVEVVDQGGKDKTPISLTPGKQLTTVANLVGETLIARTSRTPTAQVVELTPQQLHAAVAEVKVQDQTFKQAVVIDTANKSQPSLGTSTLQAITTQVATQVFTPKPPSELGLPGTFGAQPPPNVAPHPPAGLPINLVVVLKR